MGNYDTTTNRINNTRAVMLENALDIVSFAYCLGKTPEQLEQVVGDKPKRKITDNLARLIEQTFSKPKGWLDFNHEKDNSPQYDLFG